MKRDFGWCWFIPKVVGNISYWLVVWTIFIFPYIGNNNHPNSWTHIFQRGCFTTNQHSIFENCWACQFIEDFKRQYTENWTNWPTSAVQWAVSVLALLPSANRGSSKAWPGGQKQGIHGATKCVGLHSILGTNIKPHHTRKAHPTHTKPLIPSHWRGIVHVASDFWGNGLLIRGGYSSNSHNLILKWYPPN